MPWSEYDKWAGNRNAVNSRRHDFVELRILVPGQNSEKVPVSRPEVVSHIARQSDALPDQTRPFG